MKSLTTNQFWECYHNLPKEIQQRAQKAYSLFRKNKSHPSLRFKKILKSPKVYSVRISQSYRALGLKKEQKIIWFWIGSHDDYERMIEEL